VKLVCKLSRLSAERRSATLHFQYQNHLTLNPVSYQNPEFTSIMLDAARYTRHSHPHSYYITMLIRYYIHLLAIMYCCYFRPSPVSRPCGRLNHVWTYSQPKSYLIDPVQVH